MASRKRYVLVGVGQRSRHFIAALLGEHAAHVDLAALCDANAESLAARVRELGPAGKGLRTYDAAEFDRMLEAERPETVIVLTPDRTHAEYVCRAMRAGCDVVVEKPLATTAADCRQVLSAQRETGRTCRVGLNYRYAPWNTTIKRLLVEGTIGRVVSVAMRKSLGMRRGASYFHRWHARMDRSGGLLVHKGTHYFDLVNFFVGSIPRTVYARGGQRLFTDATRQRLGLERPGRRCGECEEASRCPFYADVADGPESAEVVAARAAGDGYSRDLCVFRPEADIPDTMHLVAEYESGALLNYSLLAYGDASSDAVLYGTHGRLVITGPALHVVPYGGEAYDVSPPREEGSHGGADPRMFRDLFGASAPADALGCASDAHAGAAAALVGIAATESMATGRPVGLRDLAPELETPAFVANGEQPKGFDVGALRAW